MSRKKKTEAKASFIKNIFLHIPDMKRRFILVAVITAVGKVGSAVAPKFAGMITDEIVISLVNEIMNWEKIMLLSLATAALYLVGNGIDGIVQKNMVYISQTLSKRLRNKVAKKLNRLSFDFLDTCPAGNIQATGTNDILSVGTALEASVPSLMGQTIKLVGIFIMMLTMNIHLTLIYIITLPITFGILKGISKATSKKFKEQMNVQAELNAFVSDSCSNHLVIKAFGCEKEKQKEFDRLNKEYFNKYVSSRFVSGFMLPISNLANNFSYIALCILGGMMLLKETLSLGEFQAFLFYGNMLSGPVSSVSLAFNSLAEGSAAIERILTFLDEEELSQEYLDEVSVAGTEGSIAFRNVKFGYTPDNILMNDVSFKVDPGMKVAIVGPSGAGKTTLINLLMRFYEINDGAITIDDRNIAEMSRIDVRKHFGMVLQEPWIFEGTIAENIGYGKPGATREEIINAAEISGCNSFINKLPNGYDTVISMENAAISAGEMQLLAIARCILSDPKILILDEATSQVDSRTEHLIIKAMDSLMDGRTSFVIAHRLFTIKNSDMIIFMMDGDIKEVGTHEELMKMGGYYAAMYQSA